MQVEEEVQELVQGRVQCRDWFREEEMQLVRGRRSTRVGSVGSRERRCSCAGWSAGAGKGRRRQQGLVSGGERCSDWCK